MRVTQLIIRQFSLNEKTNPMRYLVTGAAGFIGFHTAKQLLKTGHEVFGLDNINDYYDPRIKHARLELLQQHKQFRFYKRDLEDAPAIMDVIEGNKLDRVIHLAAQAGVRYSIENPQAYVQSNISGFLNVLEACKQAETPHLTYASSSSVYGAPTTGLRFFTVYGPWGRPDMALFLFTKAILAGEPINVFNYGRHQRDFTYIDDIVEGVIRTADGIAQSDQNWDSRNPASDSSYAPYRIYNIGNNKPVQLLEYIETLEKYLGKKAIRNELPLQAGDVPNTWADCSELAADFDYRPTTSIDEGVGQFVEWYQAYYGH
jgi:UDP-glucuronate 4-epimerase